jgi:hypothetical protein
MNQGIFEAIWAEPDEDGEITIRAKLASPFAELHAMQAFTEKVGANGLDWPAEEEPEALEPLLLAVGAPENAKSPTPGRNPGTLTKIVGRVGIEPTTLGLRGPCSAG